jgi:K+-sensing histidine kinase KdpD
MNRKHVSTTETFALVALSVATAAAITKLVSLALSVTPNILFVSAVTLTTIYGGIKVGAPCLITTVIVINYFFVAPLYALTLAADDLVRLIAFGFSMLIAVFIRWKNSSCKISGESHEKNHPPDRFIH